MTEKIWYYHITGQIMACAGPWNDVGFAVENGNSSAREKELKNVMAS